MPVQTRSMTREQLNRNSGPLRQLPQEPQNEIISLLQPLPTLPPAPTEEEEDSTPLNSTLLTFETSEIIELYKLERAQEKLQRTNNIIPNVRLIVKKFEKLNKGRYGIHLTEENFTEFDFTNYDFTNYADFSTVTGKFSRMLNVILDAVGSKIHSRKLNTLLVVNLYDVLPAYIELYLCMMDLKPEIVSINKLITTSWKRIRILHKQVHESPQIDKLTKDAFYYAMRKFTNKMVKLIENNPTHLDMSLII